LKTFNDVEKWSADNTSNYIKAIKMRADAQALLAISVEKVAEAQKRVFEGPSLSQKVIAGAGALFQTGGVDAYRTNLTQLQNQELTGLIDVAGKAEKAWESMLIKSEEFNKAH